MWSEPVTRAAISGTFDEIDRTYNFIISKKMPLALMNCISEYPPLYEDLNLLVEYDGEYHYKLVRGSTPELKQKRLELQQRRDKVKNEWAKANNIPLLRIPYWDFDRIEELIDAFILQHTRKKEVKQLVLEM